MEDLLEQILDELREINSKLDDIKGIGISNSIADVYDKLLDIDIKLENFEVITE